MSDLPAVVDTKSLPSSAKSMIRSFYERVKEGGSKMEKARLHAAAGAGALRQGGESIVIGGLLGFADANLKHGLELDAGGRSVPLDAVVAAAGLAGGILFATDEFGSDLRNAGAAAAAVFSYRKTHDYIASKMMAEGKVPGSATAKISGEFGYETNVAAEMVTEENDPIIAASRAMGR